VDVLRRAAQQLLDRWYPGTAVTIDWTGEAYLIQLMRGGRLGDPLWVSLGSFTTLEDDLPLCRKLLAEAWRLASEG
jgi:hypothetical protein